MTARRVIRALGWLALFALYLVVLWQAGPLHGAGIAHATQLIEEARAHV